MKDCLPLLPTFCRWWLLESVVTIWKRGSTTLFSFWPQRLDEGADTIEVRKFCIEPCLKVFNLAMGAQRPPIPESVAIGVLLLICDFEMTTL